jgi:uncharacterized protein (DUF2236 family)
VSDLGLFGPDSVTWRVHGEPVLLIGGLRALLLQALHPEAMRVLYAASNFQDDPWARLQRTAIYVGTVSFAPTEVAGAAAARVRGVHRRLGIDDPEQLAWVHACEVDSFVAAARAAGVRMTEANVDTYLLEQRVAAELVGVPTELIPTSAAALRDYFSAMRPTLAATPEARSAARMVIAPPMPVPGRFQLPARLGWTTVASLAVGLLPGWARRLYRLPPAPGAGVATAATMRALRLGLRPLPPQWREGPMYREAKARAAQLATGSASPSHG